MVSALRSLSTAEVSQHYDDLDHLYRAIWGQDLHHGLWLSGSEDDAEATRQLTELIAKRCSLRKDSSVCDIGCGYGSTAEFLASSYGAHVTGLTVSKRQWDMGRNRHPQRGSVDIRLMDWLQNDFLDSSFDALIAIESSEHMPDKQAFSTQAFRVLRPGGRFVVCAWCVSERAKVWQKSLLLEPICREGRIPSLCTPTEYRDYFAKAGFEDIQIEDLSEGVRRTWTRILLLTARYFALHPKEVKSLSPRYLPSADFARSLLRIKMAYQTGAMVYALISASKKPDSPKGERL